MVYTSILLAALGTPTATGDYMFDLTTTVLPNGNIRNDASFRMKAGELGDFTGPYNRMTISINEIIDLGGELVWGVFPFDKHEIIGNQLHMSWTETIAIGTQCPRFFWWEVVPDVSYGPDDLAAMLNAWGSSTPEWDLDGDGVVGAKDMTELLANWSG